ncbi:helix-turn-helix domain-containing protein [Streptomyces sp. NPDC059680]|uniref:helix-turn-helix domain-containing protein n=1 Tax=Streptomyces sp. NPDC059680 TaxID=3346904 RepID=UPI0036A4DAE7
MLSVNDSLGHPGSRAPDAYRRPVRRRRRETVRMQAAELFEQEIKPTEVAPRLRVSVKSVHQWHQL